LSAKSQKLRERRRGLHCCSAVTVHSGSWFRKLNKIKVKNKRNNNK
jgi:hypothetical protein